MELHKDSGSLRVIIDVSYTSANEFIDFIENEQCQFIESLGVDGLKKFEWYVNEETNTATLIEEFDRQAEKQRQIRDDVRLDIETRKKANDELAVMLEQQQEAMLKNADIAVLKINPDKTNRFKTTKIR